MAVVGLRDICLGFGGPLLFDNFNLQVEKGERLCIVGRNGCGKSTLLRLIAGVHEADSGEIIYNRGMKIASLDQQVPSGKHDTVFNCVTEGLGQQGKLISDYHQVTHDLANSTDEKLLKKLDKVSHELEAAGGWDVQKQVDTVISRMQLDPDLNFNDLSAGLKRRVLLAKALVTEPDLLLLDEPTNHLDIESIDWLEKFFESYSGTIIFVSHDRVFLDKLATRIIEIDRANLHNWDCDYNTYLKRKEDMLSGEAKQFEQFDKRLAEEEVWIRKGIQGRRTRNEGRVRELKEMREQYRERRNVSGSAKMLLQEADKSGRLVIQSKGVSFTYPNDVDSSIVDKFECMIMRGDKIGIIGPNGCGKTTLLKLLLGELEPKEGVLRHGTKLQIAYFDQLHSQLDEDKSLVDNIADGNMTINVNGSSRNVIGYLEDFLFTPSRSRAPVNNLSGGERNRLLLARVMARPCNVLVLDEPTNDLDIETLELLEEILQQYQGTVLMVSHDRAFLNNVVTSSFVFEGDGIIKEYVGGYDDWQRQKKLSDDGAKSVESSKPKPVKERSKSEKKKLSYNHQRELEKIPVDIDKLEEEQKIIHDKMAEPDFFKGSSDIIAKSNARLAELDSKLEKLYARWEELEDMS